VRSRLSSLLFVLNLLLVTGMQADPPVPGMIGPPAGERYYQWLGNGDEFVIKREEIEQSGAAVLGEILWRIPGLEVLDRGYLGADKTVSFDGLSPSHVLFLLDGEVVNDPFNQSLNLNMIPLTSIDRIEVSHGPADLDRGTHAAGSVVRITTKQFAGGEPFSSLTLAGGSFRTRLLRGEFRRGLLGEGTGLSLSFDRVASNGFDSEGDNSLLGYHLRLSQHIPKGIDLRLTGVGATSSADASSQSLEISSPVGVDNKFYHLNLVAALPRTGPAGLEVAACYDRDTRDSLDLDTSIPLGERNGTRKRLRVEGAFHFEPALSFKVGASEEGLSVTDQRDINVLALFASSRLRLGLLPTIEMAGRWEREGSEFSTLNGGVTASRGIYRYSSVFASIWRVEHRPSFQERMEEPTSLGIERERLIETGFSCRFPGVRSSLSLFHRQSRRNEAGSIESAGTTASEVRELGWRLSSGIRIHDFLSLSLGYQGIVAGDSTVGGTGTFIPSHYLTGTAEAHGSLKGSDLGYILQVSGLLVSGRDQGVQGGNSGAEGYHFVDINLGLRIVDVTVFSNARNVFNNRFEIIPGRTMPGRLWRFGLKWKFFN